MLHVSPTNTPMPFAMKMTDFLLEKGLFVVAIVDDIAAHTPLGQANATVGSFVLDVADVGSRMADMVTGIAGSGHPPTPGSTPSY